MLNYFLLWSTVYLAIAFYVDMHNRPEKVKVYDMLVLSIGIAYTLHIFSKGQV